MLTTDEPMLDEVDSIVLSNADDEWMSLVRKYPQSQWGGGSSYIAHANLAEDFKDLQFH
jgi:hypothetical protein